MGSQAFDRNQLRLAWAAIGSVVVWLFYYIFVVPGKYNKMDGNTRRLIFRNTDYTTYMGFAYDTHPVAMWTLTVVPIVLAAWWLYRGYRDEWDFLYA